MFKNLFIGCTEHGHINLMASLAFDRVNFRAVRVPVPGALPERRASVPQEAGDLQRECTEPRGLRHLQQSWQSPAGARRDPSLQSQTSLPLSQGSSQEMGKDTGDKQHDPLTESNGRSSPPTNTGHETTHGDYTRDNKADLDKCK